MRTSGDGRGGRGRRLGRRAAEELLAGAQAAQGPALPAGGGTGAGAVGTGGAGDGVRPAASATGVPAVPAPAHPAEASPDASDLTRLLSAAAGPALPEELGGEAAARAAFLAAHRPGPATTKEKPVISKLMLTKTLAVKVTAACLGLGVAGYATAAETGSLPGSWQASAHSAFGGVGVPDSKGKDKGKDGDDKAGASATGTPGAPKPSGTDADDKDKKDQDKRDGDGAWLLGADAGWLCHAAENGDKDDKGFDLKAGDLQKLAKAAGVPDDVIAKLKTRLDAEQAQAQKRIQDFCGRLDEAMKDIKAGKVPPFPVPPIKPGPGWPTTWPTQWPSGLPTGIPSTWPSDWPSHWPTGLPSGIPTGLPGGFPSKLPTGVPSLPIPTGLPGGFPSKLPTGWPSDPLHMPTVSGSGSITVHH